MENEMHYCEEGLHAIIHVFVCAPGSGLVPVMVLEDGWRMEL